MEVAAALREVLGHGDARQAVVGGNRAANKIIDGPDKRLVGNVHAICVEPFFVAQDRNGIEAIC